ncbi:MAG TPA: hypothetical protein VF033_12225 [Steroidobacteraceae bacterium]
MPDVEPPKALGGLLAAIGLVAAGGGASIDDGRYYLVIGLLLLVTGILLYAGKKLGLILYGVTLAVMWIWSLNDAQGDMTILMARVWLPTLAAFYLFSYRVRSRLA